MRIIVPIWILLFGTCLSAQEDEMSVWEKGQYDSLIRELDKAQKDLGLKLDSKTIKEDLKKTVQSFDGEKKPAGESSRYIFGVAPALRDALWTTLKSEASKESLANVNAYIEKAEEHIVYADVTAVRSIVIHLDNQLCLSESQFHEIEKLLKGNWNGAYNTEAYYLSFRTMGNLTEILGLLDPFTIQNILTENQQHVFEELGTLSTDAAQTLSSGSEDPAKMDFTATRACLEKLIPLQVAGMKLACDLDQKQIRIITIAAKGAQKSLQKTWRTFERNEISKEWMQTTPVIEQLMQRPLMQKTIQRVLSPQQLEEWNSESKRRQAIRAACYVDYLVFFYTEWHAGQRLTQQQREAITGSFKREFSGKEYTDFHKIASLVARTGEDVLKSELTEPQWEKVSSHFSPEAARYNQGADEGEADKD